MFFIELFDFHPRLRIFPMLRYKKYDREMYAEFERNTQSLLFNADNNIKHTTLNEYDVECVKNEKYDYTIKTVHKYISNRIKHRYDAEMYTFDVVKAYNGQETHQSLDKKVNTIFIPVKVGKEWVLVCMKDGEVYLVNSTSVSVKTKHKPVEAIELLSSDPNEASCGESFVRESSVDNKTNSDSVSNADNNSNDDSDSESDSENKEYVFEGNKKSLSKNNKVLKASKNGKEYLKQEYSKKSLEKHSVKNTTKQVKHIYIRKKNTSRTVELTDDFENIFEANIVQCLKFFKNKGVKFTTINHYVVETRRRSDSGVLLCKMVDELLGLKLNKYDLLLFKNKNAIQWPSSEILEYRNIVATKIVGIHRREMHSIRKENGDSG